jgi:hypothetical protein
LRQHGAQNHFQPSACRPPPLRTELLQQPGVIGLKRLT